MPSTVRAVSLGAGVQSTALLLMALEGTVDADCAIFADTHGEPVAVYSHLEGLKARALAFGFPVYTVSAGNLAEDAGGAKSITRIPAYLVGATGEREGMLPRQCTRDYKLRPIRRKLRDLVGRRGTATQLVGISLDEVHRMKSSPVKWLTMEYPLVDLRMTRWDCQRFLAERGIDAPKSACVYCPYHSDAQWRSLTPAEFEAAAQLEDRLQASMSGGRNHNLRGLPYLHRQRIPLRDVDLATPEDHGQLNWINECEGMCGV